MTIRFFVILLLCFSFSLKAELKIHSKLAYNSNYLSFPSVSIYFEDCSNDNAQMTATFVTNPNFTNINNTFVPEGYFSTVANNLKNTKQSKKDKEDYLKKMSSFMDCKYISSLWTKQELVELIAENFAEFIKSESIKADIQNAAQTALNTALAEQNHELKITIESLSKDLNVLKDRLDKLERVSK